MVEGRIVIYEPRRLVREGLAAFLGGQFEVTACAKVGELELSLRGRPAAAIVSLDGATEALWRALAGPLKARRTLRVIGIASALDPATARRARTVGVREIMPSEAGLQGVIDLLGAPRRWSSGRTVPLRVVPAPVPELTPRERDVIHRISRGLTANQIADELLISAKTVENHKQRVFRKLDVQSQSHAVAVALRLGLLNHEVRSPAPAVGDT
ncbi:MAG TPA: response regulator transcription factor [Acidimicrobiia bacterium]